jgi:hypothetical protein
MGHYAGETRGFLTPKNSRLYFRYVSWRTVKNTKRVYL